MIEVGFSLLVLPPQAADRIDFSLEPGVVLVAALAFILINVLIGAALYPYFKSGSGQTQSGAAAQSGAQEEFMGEAADTSGGQEELDERVDEFLEDIEKKG